LLILLCACTSPLFAQKLVIPSNPTETAEGLPEVTVKNVKELDRVWVPYAKPESQANFDGVFLMDLEGNQVVPELGKVTIIEYWTEKSNETNLYWNRVRDLEKQYAGTDQLQVISIHYDPVKSGRELRESMPALLKKLTPPENVYLDPMISLREKFLIPGPIAYLLIDHRNQYVNGGRADNPKTTDLFDYFLDQSLKYQQMERERAAQQKN
jgi:hypothetical protein